MVFRVLSDYPNVEVELCLLEGVPLVIDSAWPGCLALHKLLNSSVPFLFIGGLLFFARYRFSSHDTNGFLELSFAFRGAGINGSMPFCVELDNLKDTDAPIHQPAAMLVAAD